MFSKYIYEMSLSIFNIGKKITEFLNKEVELHATSSVLSRRVLCQLFTLPANDTYKRVKNYFLSIQTTLFLLFSVGD